jgi:hypothetical protein
MVGGHRHVPAALPLGKGTLYSLYRRLGGPQGRSGRVRKISPPTGILFLDRPSRRESVLENKVCIETRNIGDIQILF